LKIAVLVGTRPEIIKLSPIVREFESRTINFFIIHSGQHYSYNMDQVFFEQLKLPAARYNLEVGSGSHAETTAKVMIGTEKILSIEKPDIILVQGDTNTVLAGAMAAAKICIKIGHVEAGLRSYDRRMPEEINRILTDHCSDYLFCPTEKSKKILLDEGIPQGNIFVTGNTIVDAVYQNLEIAEYNGNILESLNLEPKKYFLMTLHRQENVDIPLKFCSILKSLEEMSSIYNLPVIFPIHPRSRKMMSDFGFTPKRIILIEPIDFFGFLQLEKNAKLILTDSGGVQEESCILRTPCVTLRENTERPETLEVGASMLAGADHEKILECSEVMMKRSNGWVNPFGDGRSSKRIVNILTSHNSFLIDNPIREINMLERKQVSDK
jgi:UDP-N-acetylglucosamine 2-epimerase (non-hydrolysing)